MNDWQKQYLCEWEPDTLYALAQEYHERCEAYDRTVCTGPLFHGAVMPVTPDERRSVIQHAKVVRDEIIARTGANPRDLARAISRYDR